MQKGMERRYFLYNPHVTIEIARIRSNQSEILEWNEERSRYSAKTKHSRKGGKKESSWKVIQHRALHSVDPQCWDLCCRKCKNLENAVVMVVPISRAETLAACVAALVAIQICGVFAKGKNFTWDFSYSKPDDANAVCNEICRQCYSTGEVLPVQPRLRKYIYVVPNGPFNTFSEMFSWLKWQNVHIVMSFPSNIHLQLHRMTYIWGFAHILGLKSFEPKQSLAFSLA